MLSKILPRLKYLCRMKLRHRPLLSLILIGLIAGRLCGEDKTAPPENPVRTLVCDIAKPDDIQQLVADVIGYRGEFVFDTSRPDGASQKLLDAFERLGWRAKTPLREGIAAAFANFLASGGE